MAQVVGTATSWNLPNFSGELFTASATQTPLLSMIGGLTGGVKVNAPEFSTSLMYDLPDEKQPEISERASLVAPTPTHVAREQETNVIQIHHEAIELSYSKQASMGQMSGINIAGQTANPANDMTFQREAKLKVIARDVEHSFIAGKFQKATSDSVPNKTRGLLELTKAINGTSIDAGAAKLNMAMLKALYLEMYKAGATFENTVMFVGAQVKQAISEIYNLQQGYALPPTRNVGGVNITEIEFDFGKMGVALNRFMPEDSLLIADVSVMAPVFQEIPNKGILFIEPIAKAGASDREQFYGHIGLAHGPAFLHGSITNIEV